MAASESLHADPQEVDQPDWGKMSAKQITELFRGEEPDDDLIVDEDFRVLWQPQYTKESLETLQCALILAGGALLPITVWGKIVIRNIEIYEICRDCILPFTVTKMEFATREEVKQWIRDEQAFVDEVIAKHGGPA